MLLFTSSTLKSFFIGYAVFEKNCEMQATFGSSIRTLLRKRVNFTRNA
jgi:hypothetical protein